MLELCRICDNLGCVAKEFLFLQSMRLVSECNYSPTSIRIRKVRKCQFHLAIQNTPPKSDAEMILNRV